MALRKHDAQKVKQSDGTAYAKCHGWQTKSNWRTPNKFVDRKEPDLLI